MAQRVRLASSQPASRVRTKNPSTRRDNDKSRIASQTLEKRIQERAYQLYEQRGCAHGFDREDWAEAEAQIKRELRIS